jgi:peptidoglycan/LPS O-acetylase OafA/YrhL
MPKEAAVVVPDASHRMPNAKTDGLPKIPRINNFDFLRFMLAFSVFLGHFGSLAKVDMGPCGEPFGIVAHYAVRCFFVISGFLIFMSYENSRSLKEYFAKRFRRIYPAYCFIVLVTAFGLALLSKLTWQNYFLSPELFRYIFFNLLFISNAQPTLPGVFTENPIALVNGPFWTLKVEVLFYALVPILVLLFRAYKKVVLIGLLYAGSFLYFVGMNYLYHKTGNHSFETLSRQLPGALAFFLSGALLYYYFNFFKQYSGLYFAVSIVIFILQYNLHDAEFFHPVGLLIHALLPMALGGIVFFVAFSTPHTNLFSKYGDLSYGIYIFHYPIVQVFTDLNLYDRYPYFAPGMTVVTVLGLAFLAWHLIEKQFLSRRSHYITG